jgi:hypothetical protein
MPRDIDKLGRVDGDIVRRSDLARDSRVMVQGMPGLS